MADFQKAFEKTMAAEGGYKLTDIPGDAGGQTYAGIARKRNPQWAGWPLIDKGDIAGAKLAVAAFYRANFWNAMRGDEIANQLVAETLYDFGVNAGPGTAVKLAQERLGLAVDGNLGPKTLAALNHANGADLVKDLAFGKLLRYSEICRRDPAQLKFLPGWINRTLAQVA